MIDSLNRVMNQDEIIGPVNVGNLNEVSIKH